ncbi:MAG: hypothetical protein H6754_05635 [Candidatus Omnitrophica bacterium]|nr:hypothetical protein [Candidatus Omnitrophota bacterium]
MAKDTAESKLLKLIEETDAKDKTGNPAAPAAGAAASPDVTKVLNSVSTVGVGSISLPPFLQKILSAFFPKSGAGFGLRFFNQILLFVILGVGVFFVMDFSKGMKQSQVEVAYDVVQAEDDGKDVVLPTINDVVDYIATVSSRNIFRPFEKKAEEAKIVAPLENQRIKDKVVNFKLVGISWLSTPETATAMIEDKGTSVTYFLKTGDDFGKMKQDMQGLKIDVIYADRVEFSFQGEKLTMNL